MVVDVKPKYVELKDVKPGESFYFSGNYYMKVCKNEYFSCVNLRNGCLAGFDEDTVVEPFDFKVVPA